MSSRIALSPIYQAPLSNHQILRADEEKDVTHLRISSGLNDLDLRIEQGAPPRQYIDSIATRALAANQVSPRPLAHQNAYEKMVRYIYSHSNQTVRNLGRVALAGGLSTLGGVISGDPRVAATLNVSLIFAVTFGSAFGGIGNALSTWLAWETDIDNKVLGLERFTSDIAEKLELAQKENKDLRSSIELIKAQVSQDFNQKLSALEEKVIRSVCNIIERSVCSTIENLDKRVSMIETKLTADASRIQALEHQNSKGADLFESFTRVFEKLEKRVAASETKLSAAEIMV